jgi:hypothetical protein
MDISNFKVDSKLPLNVLFDRLLSVLDLNNLQFKVNKKHEDLGAPPFRVNQITMSGEPNYVSLKLKQFRSPMIDLITAYSDSEESNHTKINMLGTIQIKILERVFNWDILLPELYEGPMYFDLIDLENELQTVSIKELIISDNQKNEIIEHHNIRLAFLKLINKHIEIQLLKLQYNISPSIEDKNTSELDLTELWMGLEIVGCFNGLNKNEKSITRKKLYDVFGVIDKNYNDKHNQIKNRGKTKFRYLEKMILLLNKKYK